MTKKAYISFEGEYAKVFIPEGDTEKSAFFHVESNRIFSFVKDRKIKKVSVTHFIPELLSLSIPLVFSPETVPKKRILENLIKVEINRRQTGVGGYSFSYEICEVSGKVQLRVYVVDEKHLEKVENFIKQDIDVSSFYPFFMPLMEFVKQEKGSLEGDFILCFISGDMRYLYIFRGREMILQRSFQGVEGEITEEDNFNISATINYAIQNLRIKPEKFFLVGVKEKVFPETPIPCEIISIDNGVEDFLMCYLLAKFEDHLEGKGFLPPSYVSYKKAKKIGNYLVASLVCLFSLSFLWDAVLISDTVKLTNTLKAHKREIASRETDFFKSLEYINRFESSVKPILDLQNRKNRTDDIREALYPIAEASKIVQVKLVNINVDNGKPQKISVTGSVPKSSFSERQITYMQFRKVLLEKGLKIENEKWSFVNGEFHLEGTYDAGGAPKN
ncbi:MAG: hypothetical protein N2317_07050 [Syntrophales bacterium]|nr:hypothetical protein [Syntrophales bacterium]